MGGGGAASGTLNGLSPELSQLVQSYLTNAVPELTSLGGSLSGQFGSSYNSATGVGKSLENFNALPPAEIAALSSASGAAVESAGRTAQATSGGVPNQALQNKNLSLSAGQQSGQTATQLGAISAEQKLSAEESAGNLFQGLSGESLNGILSALGIQEGALGTGVQGQLGVANLQNQQQQEKNQTIASSFGGLASLAGNFFNPGVGSVSTPGADPLFAPT